MNTPNKLTVLRVILIPIYMILYLNDSVAAKYAAIAVFVIATMTDQLDGHLARKNNQITTFGKLMDPLADKMLIMAALVSFVEKDVPYITAGVVMIILGRELIVTGIRLIAVGENTVIAASMWGKSKTVSQFILVLSVMIFDIVTALFPAAQPVCSVFILIMTIVAVALTIYSGVDYIVKNRALITFK